MNYDNIIDLLLREFPELKESLKANDYIYDLPFCIIEMLFIPYVKNLCEKSKKQDLSKLGIFLEKMAVCEDKKINELLNIAFWEPIVLADKEIIPVLQRFLGKRSLEDLDYWKHRYCRSI